MNLIMNYYFTIESLKTFKIIMENNIRNLIGLLDSVILWYS